jgi:hypothetical protein
MPESGMGYQRVLVRLKAGRVIKNALVYNVRVLERLERAITGAG